MKRKVPFEIGKYYHVFNRGVDKRIIFSNQQDFHRFLQSMDEFNVVEPIGSIYTNSKKRKAGHKISKSEKLVDFVCFAINPNHFHFILTPFVENGIEKFMQRFSAGYTKYFNHKNERNGVLFQGAFKSVYIDSDEYLVYLSAYINLNYKIHHIKKTNDFVLSSWDEYVNKKSGFCNKKNIILKMFDKSSRCYKESYKNFAESVANEVIERRGKMEDDLGEDEKGLNKLNLE